MVRLSEQELGYLLSERRLGRIVTLEPSGRPHVVPVGWSYNAESGTIDVSGRNFAASKKFRNVQANPATAFIVDDVLPPWRPRGVMVQGTGQALDAEAGGGGEAMIRITPENIISWGELDARADRPAGS
jgi:PPOX class F420-dependent enzyme/OxyR family protein